MVCNGQGVKMTKAHLWLSGHTNYGLWYNEILLSLEMEGNSDVCYTMNKPWKQHDNWNQLVTKTKAVWTAFHEAFRMVRFIETEPGKGLPGTERGWGVNIEWIQSFHWRRWSRSGDEWRWWWCSKVNTLKTSVEDDPCYVLGSLSYQMKKEKPQNYQHAYTSRRGTGTMEIIWWHFIPNPKVFHPAWAALTSPHPAVYITLQHQPWCLPRDTDDRSMILAEMTFIPFL